MADNKVVIVIKAEDDASKVIEQLKQKLNGMGKPVNEFKQSTAGLASTFMNFKTIATGAVVSLGVSMLNTAGRFEKFQSILTNTLGSVTEAKNAMALLKDVSAQTPFELDKLTESYIKLANRGFKPNRDQIVQLGDLASSLGKEFDQLVEAMLDAQTGEFERLKEFGVRSQVSGNQVAFTFKGVTTSVAKTDEAIKNYILGLGKLKGVQGSMVAQSNTYEGKISNLKDARTNLSATIGGMFIPTASKSIGVMTQMLNSVNKNIQEVQDRGMSTNVNVLMVANAFSYLKKAGDALPSISFSMGAMSKSIAISALNAINPLNRLFGAVNSVLKLVGVDIGKSINNFVDAQKAKAQKQADVNVAIKLATGTGTDIAQQAKDQLDMIKKINSSPIAMPKMGGGGGGGGGKSKEEIEKEKAKNRQIEQEKELIKVTQQRITQVDSLNISEARKAQLMVQINDDMASKLKEIRGNDMEDSVNTFETIAEKAKERIESMKDKFKTIYDTVKDAIGKSKDAIADLDEKIKDNIDKIKDLNNQINDLGKDTQTALTDRYVDAVKDMAKIRDDLLKPIDDAKQQAEMTTKLTELQNELQFISKNVDQKTLDTAMAFDRLSPAEKIQEKANQKKAEFEIQIKAIEDENKLLSTQRNDELVKLENFNIAKNKIEKRYTSLFKDELNERSKAYEEYIVKLQSLGGVDKGAVAGLTGTVINGARADGGPVSSGATYLVGERGPELFVPKSSGYIVPNDKMSGGVNVSINGVNINNGMDLDNFKDVVEKTIIKSVRNLQAGIY